VDQVRVRLSDNAVMRWGGGIVVATIGGIFASMIATSNPQTAPRPQLTSTSSRLAPTQTPPTPASTEPELAIVTSRGYESEFGGYHYVEGQVRNLTSSPIENFTAVATWFTKDGTFITTDEGLIDFNPLMPGQTSSFKTITRGNPQMLRFSVTFKRLFGGQLRVRNDTTKWRLLHE
jgi:hypothetical protein